MTWRQSRRASETSGHRRSSQTDEKCWRETIQIFGGLNLVLWPDLVPKFAILPFQLIVGFILRYPFLCYLAYIIIRHLILCRKSCHSVCTF